MGRCLDLRDPFRAWTARPGNVIRNRQERLSKRIERVESELTRLETAQKSSPHRFKLADAQFREASQAVLSGERTLLGEDRLWILWQAVRNTRRLKLPAAEVGSYRGGSAFFLADAFERFGTMVPLEVVDTFAGHPARDVTASDDPIHGGGHFGDTSFDDVRTYLARFPTITVRQGAFGDVAPRLPHSTYGLAHLDVDLYKPTREALEYFADRLAIGGVIVVDDYGATKCPGIKQAAEEFLVGRDQFQSWHAHTQQLVLVKTEPGS